LVLAGGQFMPAPYLLLALALSFFYVAGMSLNDVCDVEHDRPSGLRVGQSPPAGSACALLTS
jgi:hypothetical protein